MCYVPIFCVMRHFWENLQSLIWASYEVGVVLNQNKPKLSSCPILTLHIQYQISTNSIQEFWRWSMVRDDLPILYYFRKVLQTTHKTQKCTQEHHSIAFKNAYSSSCHSTFFVISWQNRLVWLRNYKQNMTTMTFLYLTPCSLAER